MSKESLVRFYDASRTKQGDNRASGSLGRAVGGAVRRAGVEG